LQHLSFYGENHITDETSFPVATETSFCEAMAEQTSKHEKASADTKTAQIIAAVFVSVLVTFLVTLTLIFSLTSSFEFNASPSDALLLSLGALQAVIAGVAIILTLAGLFSITSVRALIARNVDEKVEQRIDTDELREHITSQINRRFEPDGELEQKFRAEMEIMIEDVIDRKLALNDINVTSVDAGSTRSIEGDDE
jgi:hypothetical protein